MLCTGIFTKYAVDVLIKNKGEDDIAAGILECMQKMYENF